MKKKQEKRYSYWITYSCGCQHHVYKSTVYEPSPGTPCWFCAHPTNEEWLQASEGLKEKRKAAGLSIGGIPGVEDEDVLLMERGRMDPAPLIAFLNNG